MGGCSALNCSNSGKKGFQMFNFPSNEEQRKRWAINCKRKDWNPSKTAQLCVVHFEPSQLELKRQDGRRKLKWNAVPTLFDIPNPPKQINYQRKSKYKIRPDLNFHITDAPSDSSLVSIKSDDPSTAACITLQQSCSQVCLDSIQSMKSNDLFEAQPYGQDPPEIAVKCVSCAELKAENEKLKRELKKQGEIIQKCCEFLTPDQVSCLTDGKVRHWGQETIVKCLKMRFALGVHGYNFLRSTNYPAPCYSTLSSRMSSFRLNFGMFHDLVNPLKNKVECMDPSDRFCFLSMDEMQISPDLAYDKNKNIFLGHCTLGDTSQNGSKLLVVLIRGIKWNWKQIIAAHITTYSTSSVDLKQFVLKCIDFCRNVGLTVVAIGSDMGNENRKLWTTLDVGIPKHGVRSNRFQVDDTSIFVFPDPCHLMKNLKNAMLSVDIVLPIDYCEANLLPTNLVRGRYIQDLWNIEVDQKKELRFLYHLKHEHLFPDNFQKMNVAGAIHYFSNRTVAALEKAVYMKLLPVDALTTVHWMKLFVEWIDIMLSKVRKCSITNRNRERKFNCLEHVINLIEGVQFGTRGWKPLNVGIIMASLSLIDICDALFLRNYDFVMGHRFSQDATENVFSVVRRKSGQLPTAVQCLRALKTISVSQFLSDVKRTNYCTDSDVYMVNFFKDAPPKSASVISPDSITSPSMVLTSQRFDTLQISDLTTQLDEADINNLYYIAGSTTNFMLKRTCDSCQHFLRNASDKNLSEMKAFTLILNKGGLKEPSTEVLTLVLNCEKIYRKHKTFILHNASTELIDKINKDLEICFPSCCDLKLKTIKHFFDVRSYSSCSIVGIRKRKAVYGTSSAKRKKID